MCHKHRPSTIALYLMAWLGISALPAAFARARTNQPITEWRAAGVAYVEGNDQALDRYAESTDIPTRYYAKALRDLSAWKFDNLAEYGTRCYDSTPQTSAAAVALFQCLFAVTTGEAIANRPKASLLWRTKASMFYRKYSGLIDNAFGLSNPYGAGDLSAPSLQAITGLPEQVIHVKRDWQTIPLNDGMVQATIGTLPVEMLVDTGSTNIFLSADVIRELSRHRQLIRIDGSESIGTITRDSVIETFYVPHLQVGPISIANAYVSSTNNKTSIFGLRYLRALENFTLSHNAIRPAVGSTSSFCGKMKFTHLRVVDTASYPYFVVPTSLGRIGLMLDSGLTAQGPFAGTSLSLRRDFGPRIGPGGAQAKGVQHRSVVTGALSADGQWTRFKTFLFTWEVNGISTRGYVGLDPGAGSDVAGSMTSDFLRIFDVTYNYPDRTMCIAPTRSDSNIAERR